MNPSRLSNRRWVLISAVLAFLLVLIPGGMAIYVLSDRGLHQALSVARVAFGVEKMYPGQLDWDAMLLSGMDGIFAKLDPYSSYVEREQFERMDEELTGGYSGIGISVIRQDLGLLVMSVRENGPAARVGLEAGDIIMEADSIPLVNLSLESASRHLRGKEGTRVNLKVWRAVSNDTLTVTVTRQRIDFMHIPFAGYTPDTILYLRLLDFDAGAADDVATALDSLLSGDTNPHGMILDLRGNPGGLFSEAYRIADLFLEAGKFIVGTDSRSRWKRESHFSDSPDRTGGLPMAVIVDRGTASAAEIVAGALQELDRAFLVGDTTFGKGLVQGFTRFPDGSGIRLTISRYYLAGDIFLNEFDSTLVDTGHGLAPDYYFSFVDQHEFPRILENSLLLFRFANRFHEAIMAESGKFGLSDAWVTRFERFAKEEGFTFTSSLRDSAKLVVDMAYLEKSRMHTVKAAQRILRLAKKDDREQFAQYAGYIKTRLKEIAYDRELGTYQRYANIVVRERPDIQLATSLLLEKQ